jgi:hypothetical protein
MWGDRDLMLIGFEGMREGDPPISGLRHYN